MEKNTVTISLEDYNELRDFKKEMTEYSKVAIFGNKYPHRKLRFITKDQAVIELEKEIEALMEANSQIMGELYRERNRLDSLKEDIKKMSICQFLKWRNK